MTEDSLVEKEITISTEEDKEAEEVYEPESPSRPKKRPQISAENTDDDKQLETLKDESVKSDD